MRAPELDLTVDVAELDVADEDLAIDADGGPTMNLSGPCPRSAGLSGQARNNFV